MTISFIIELLTAYAQTQPQIRVIKELVSDLFMMVLGAVSSNLNILV